MRTNLLIAVIFLLCAILGVVIFLLWQRWESGSVPVAEEAGGVVGVSGTFDINGVVPEGATVSILSRQHGSSGAYQTVATSLPATDRNSWSFEGLERGVSYEVMGNVVAGGSVVASSSPIVVSAPASEETLVFNVVAPTPVPNVPTPTTSPATVSGTVRVNGYIPGGSTITLQARRVGSGEFQNVVNSLPATQSQVVNYTNATAGVSYEVVGQMYDSSGNSIGSSSTLTITAPALHELLTINSQASAPTVVPTPVAATGTPVPSPTPVGTVAVSGKINFNGAAPANSRIVIFQRVHETSDYQVAVDNVTPLDGTSWTWNGAKNATWYDMIAILKQKQSNGTDKDIADSQVLTVASPASGQTFTINSGQSLSAPGNNITITCGDRSGANVFNPTLSFASVDGAQAYWFQVGSTNGGSEILSTAQNAQDKPLQTIQAQINNGVTYYARYAYSEVSGTPAGSQNFSSFSGTKSFVCN